MPFVEGSLVSIPSLRRRMVCGAVRGVEKNALKDNISFDIERVA